MKIRNRYAEDVEIMFDGRPIKWKPGEEKDLPDDIALFCRLRSTVKDNPITGNKVRALVILGIDKDTDQLSHRGPELLDRSDMSPQDQVEYLPIANPVQRTELENERVAARRVA